MDGQQIDEFFMAAALDLAANGFNAVAPNPMVGAIIVHNGRIIGRGFHECFGHEHAERRAVADVAAEEKRLLPESTLYVTLEPCCHFGRTPPCADFVIECGFQKVIIGSEDPNRVVNGAGIRRLIDSGISVRAGVLEQECRNLNKRFFTFHAKDRPYVILKWAETSDGFIARLDFSSKWISGQDSRALVHKWRAEESAILVGTTTALADNPKLTVRHIVGKNPLIVLIDRELKVPRDSNVFNREAEVLVINELRSGQFGLVEYAKTEFDGMLPSRILSAIHERKKTSLIVEGGGCTLSSFIRANLWDEARIFVGMGRFESGIPAPSLDRVWSEFTMVGSDRLYIVQNGDCRTETFPKVPLTSI